MTHKRYANKIWTKKDLIKYLKDERKEHDSWVLPCPMYPRSKIIPIWSITKIENNKFSSFCESLLGCKYP